MKLVLARGIATSGKLMRLTPQSISTDSARPKKKKKDRSCSTTNLIFFVPRLHRNATNATNNVHFRRFLIFDGTQVCAFFVALSLLNPLTIASCACGPHHRSSMVKIPMIGHEHVHRPPFCSRIAGCARAHAFRDTAAWKRICLLLTRKHSPPPVP